MRTFKHFLLVFLFAIFLTACGDDVTKTYMTNEISGMEIVASVDSLGKCTEEHFGEMKFASKENAVFVCADSAWKNVSAEGKDGADGKDGSSCMVEMLADSSGYKVVCGSDSVGVVLNGEKGEAGKDGETCSFTDNGDGTILQICGKDSVTLYKALCGNKPFDPIKSFCVADSVVSLCGGKVYDLSENFCFDDSVYELCGGNIFEPNVSFCDADTIVSMCGEETFNPIKNFCFENEVYPLCGKIYTPISQFCDVRDSSIYKFTIIDSQTWMAENLNYAYLQKTAEEDSSSFCYDNNLEYCEKYGRLYLWSAAMDSAAHFTKNGEGCGWYYNTCSPNNPVRGICPEGWHLPDGTEWTLLINFVAEQIGNNDSVGYVLKSTTENGSNVFGFDASLGGFRTANNIFQSRGSRTGFWSSTKRVANNAEYFGLSYDTNIDRFRSEWTRLAFSIRCIKD